jgi:uncharacterized protein (DUF362 family)
LLKYETNRYIIKDVDGKLIGHEKKHEILKKDEVVLIKKLDKDIDESVSDAFDKIEAEKEIHQGDLVAIKINLGGGIDYIPTTYSDPHICEAIIKKVRILGSKPFVCEANMRARIINEKLLKIREYWGMLKKNNCKFVNLSDYSTVRMNCQHLDIPLKLPEILLKPNVKIISFAPPKHHWECGITCNQKNMYGAIAEYKKSIYHRKYERIDQAVAAAARIMSPAINVLAAFDLGTGLGPHFIYPVKNFNRMIISKDMSRGDKVASEILGYPFNLVKYAMINTGGKDVVYQLHSDSDWPDKEMLEQIRTNAFDRGGVSFWKPTLYLQYFLPHEFQIWLFPRMESFFTWINREFYKN